MAISAIQGGYYSENNDARDHATRYEDQQQRVEQSYEESQQREAEQREQQMDGDRFSLYKEKTNQDYGHVAPHMADQLNYYGGGLFHHSERADVQEEAQHEVTKFNNKRSSWTAGNLFIQQC